MPNLQQLKEALKQIEQFVKDIKAAGFTEMPPDTQRAVSFSRGELGGMTLWADEVTRYAACITKLQKAVNDKSEVFSEKSAENGVQDVLLGALDLKNLTPKKTFDQKLALSLQELRNRVTTTPRQWDIYFQVLGIELKDASFPFGRVRFVAADRQGRKYLLQRTLSILEGSPDSPETKLSYIKYHKKLLRSDYSKGVIAWVQVSALDVDAARARALDELKRTLDVLNFFTQAVHLRDLNVRAFLPGEAEYRAQTTTYTFDGQNTVYAQAGIHGPFVLFDIAKLNGNRAKSWGVIRISQILRKDSPNEFEQRILAAMLYAGRGIVQKAREESFLHFSISLEALLGDQKAEGDITYKLRTRCAHLIGGTAAARKEISLAMRDLYAVRSDIVHRGVTEMTDLKIGRLRWLARSAMVAVLTRPQFIALSEVRDFLNWLEDKVLD